jgi:hypothetical protein
VSPQELTKGQRTVLIAASVPMLAAGGLGAWGTYTNVAAEFDRAATALGVVAAGEGLALVLALLMVGLTMLGQSAPTVVRAGLWAAPVAAAVMGLAIADDPTEAVIYALTPLAMSASAEGIGLLARRIVVFRTGTDMEAQRHNAATVQQLAYHRARAANHPTGWVRWRSERAAWRLARRVGVGDMELGAELVRVQRDRLTDGADTALLGMFGTTPQGTDDRPKAPAPAVTAEVPAPQDGEGAEVTIERAPGPAGKVVIPAVAALPPALPVWDTIGTAKVTTPAPAGAPRELVTGSPAGGSDAVHPDDAPAGASNGVAVPAESGRRVVTETVTLTPADLRRKARSLHREAVRDGRRGVTIEQLRDELGLSRRDATELRREVCAEARS